MTKVCDIEDCSRPVLARGWCSLHYNRWRNQGDPEKTVYLRGSVENRLRSVGWTVSETDCWTWNGSTNRDGYGRLRISNKKQGVHRLAYEAWVGPIPEGMDVRHKCDNPPCINPEHLDLGTQADNVHDMQERGRAKKARGTGHPQSKFSLSDIDDIRWLVGLGASIKSVAKAFNVWPSTVHNLITGKTYVG